jgi:hypothetical protein
VSHISLNIYTCNYRLYISQNAAPSDGILCAYKQIYKLPLYIHCSGGFVVHLTVQWIILGWISRRWDVGYVDWIGLAQDRDRWRTLVSAVMNLRVQ